MRVSIPFLAQSTSIRHVEVDIPDGTAVADIRRVAEAAAVEAMNRDDDYMNHGGTWATNMVEPKTIFVDGTRKVSFPAPAEVFEPDGRGGIAKADGLSLVIE